MLFSLILSVVPSVYMMTHNINAVTSSASSNLFYYFSLPFPCRKAALSSPFPFLIVDVVVVLGLVVMFKLLYLLGRDMHSHECLLVLVSAITFFC